MDKEGFKPLLAACWLLFIIKFQALLLLPPDGWRGMLLFDICHVVLCYCEVYCSSGAQTVIAVYPPTKNYCVHMYTISLEVVKTTTILPRGQLPHTKPLV